MPDLPALAERASAAIIWAADAVFGPWTLALLLGSGLYLSIRLRFVQVTRFREALRSLVPAAQAGAKGPLTPFQAFMTALAASIGTGNIAGVATAIISGGPGALFWIWVYGFVATSIKFAEAVLGVRFRQTIDGHVQSGPMYFLRDGLRSPGLAWTYAAVAGIAALTTTPAPSDVPSSSLTLAMRCPTRSRPRASELMYCAPSVRAFLRNACMRP